MARQAEVTAAVTASGQFTTAVSLERGGFDLSISGTFDGTITVQRSFDAGVSWLDVDSYTSPTEQVGENAERGTLWRAGAKAGEFTSGTATIRLGQ